MNFQRERKKMNKKQKANLMCIAKYCLIIQCVSEWNNEISNTSDNIWTTVESYYHRNCRETVTTEQTQQPTQRMAVKFKLKWF